MRSFHSKFLILISLLLVLLFFYCYWLEDSQNPQSLSLVSHKQRNGTEEYNVWCIFTRVKEEQTSFRIKFQSMLVSLLKNTDVVISLNVITDVKSRYMARDVVENARITTGKYLNAAYHDIHDLANKIEGIIEIMKKHFSSQPGAYYSSSLFFISIGLHKVTLMKRAVMLDIDTFVKADIADLFDEFDNFGTDAVLGAAPELTPVYHHILYSYRSSHKDSKLGTAASEGGFPGINSGVLLLDLEKMRKSVIYQGLLIPGEVDKLAKEFKFKGHLGDQDFYTLVALKHPYLVHLIDCGWNRQLCTWWRDHGYQTTFHTFAACSSLTKIYHGNCNTHIPDK
uniref:Xyloside xylosyltransferase 1 n=1 Tax=Lygus hesperus TaxID=30085 RepID=A0A0A9WZ56_LYGHE